MIISRKHKFVFYRTHKTASSILQFVLSGLCGPRDVIVPLSPLDELHRFEMGGRGPQCFSSKHWVLARTMELSSEAQRPPHFWKKHQRPDSVRKILGRKYANFEHIAVVRNPFETVISDYFWLQRDPKSREVPKWSVRDFDRFLDANLSVNRNESFFISIPNYQDFTFWRYESLGHDLRRWLEGRNFDARIADSISQNRIKNLAIGNRPSARSVYENNRELVLKVRSLFPNLISHFDYSPPI